MKAIIRALRVLTARTGILQRPGTFVVTLSLLLSFGSSLTQAETAEEARGIEEVVVTAQKRAQSIMDAAIDVTAFSGEQLTAAGIDDS